MKALIATIISVSTLGLAAFTNPKMTDYEQFIHKKITHETENSDALSKTFGLLFGGLASNLVARATARSDYVFLSVYDTDIDSNRIRVIGAWNNFFVVTRSSREKRSLRRSPVTTDKQAAPDFDFGTTRSSRVDFIAATSNRWSPININNFLEQRSWDVIEKSERSRFVQLLGDDFPEFINFIAVGGGIRREGDFFVGTGCMAHDCHDKQGIFVVDAKSGRAYAASIKDQKIKAWGIDEAAGWPRPIGIWLAENGLVVDTVHDKVMHGLALASAAKIAVSEYFAIYGKWPADNAAAGMAAPTSISGNSVREVAVLNGVITVTFSPAPIEGQQIVLKPKNTSTDNSSRVRWDCVGGNLEDKYRPSSCRM